MRSLTQFITDGLDDTVMIGNAATQLLALANELTCTPLPHSASLFEQQAGTHPTSNRLWKRRDK